MVQDDHFEEEYSDDDTHRKSFLPDTDAQGWEAGSGSVKKIRRRTKVKKNKQPVLLDDETPKRRPLGREFHKNKENQRWDSHNKMGKSRKRTAGQKKQQARRLTRSQKEKDEEQE